MGCQGRLTVLDDKPCHSVHGTGGIDLCEIPRFPNRVSDEGIYQRLRKNKAGGKNNSRRQRINVMDPRGGSAL
jgi:hypothetical protein